MRKTNKQRLKNKFFFFFFNDTATTEIYTLSLHDALPICQPAVPPALDIGGAIGALAVPNRQVDRSEEHTSELQTPYELVRRRLLEKKKYRDHGHESSYRKYTSITSQSTPVRT